MKLLHLVLLVYVIIAEINGMNEKQLAAAVKMVRNVCQPKTKATNEDIDKMHNGDWDVDHTAMCYMYCCFNMNKLMNKENKFDYDSGMTQLKLIPPSLQEPTKLCMNQCKDAAVTLSDKCVAAHEISKCLYFCNPDKYYLP